MVCQFSARLRFTLAIGIVLLLGPLTAYQAVFAQDNNLTGNGAKRSTEKPDLSDLAAEVESPWAGRRPLGAAADSGQSPAAPAATHPADQQMLAEIRAIRQQLGGSVTEQLSELFDHAPDGLRLNPLESEREFDRTVERLAVSERGIEPASEPIPANESVGEGVASPFPVERLHAAARLLEQAAAELELASRFDDADSLREKARQLWRLARPSDASVWFNR
jgi:hypothetical protein